MVATTFFLLKNPECYKRLTQEIRQRFSSYQDISATSAQQLPYLQAVISEGLRIYPPGPQGLPRISPGKFIGGFFIPPGVSLCCQILYLTKVGWFDTRLTPLHSQTEVYTSGWTIAHDAKYFADPMSFKPERWIDPGNTDVKEASQPFLLGPRGCLGRKLVYSITNPDPPVHYLSNMVIIASHICKSTLCFPRCSGNMTLNY